MRTQQRVVAHAINRDIEKLASRGLGATEPLIGHLEGDVRYLRTKCEPHGIFRLFYFRDGPDSVVMFYPYTKKTDKLPGRVRREVMMKYNLLTGRR